MPSGVRITGPWSRRRVLTWAGGLAGTSGALVLAAHVAERGQPTTAHVEVAGASMPNVGGLPADTAPPAPMAAPTRPLQVAIFTGGRFSEIDARPLEVLRGAVAELDTEGAAAQRRDTLRLEVLEIAQAAPTPATVASSNGATQARDLAPLLGSGAPPDVVFYTGEWAGGAAYQRELLEARQLRGARPLDQYLRGGAGFAAGDYFAPALDVCRHGGQLHALPVLVTPTLLLYGHRVFGERPMLRPSAQWSWSDLAGAATQLTKRAVPGATPDEYGLFLTGSPAPLLSLIWQNGGEAIETAPDGTRRAALDSAAAREAIDFYAALHRGGGGAGGGAPAVGEGVAVPMGGGYAASADGMSVGGKRVAMLYDSPGGLPVFPEWEWLGVAPLPRGRKRAGSLGVRGSLAVPVGAAFPDASSAAVVRLAKRLMSRVELPAGPQPPSAVTDALVTSRQAFPTSPPLTPEVHEVLVERGRVVMESSSHARVLTVGDMDRTLRLHGALAGFAMALQRPNVSIDQATEAAQRALQDALR